MRISDWSSDVCSSDLSLAGWLANGHTESMILSAAYLARMAFSQGVSPCIVAHPLSPRATTAAIITRFIIAPLLLLAFTIRPALGQIGRASCRARECQYV